LYSSSQFKDTLKAGVSKEFPSINLEISLSKPSFFHEITLKYSSFFSLTSKEAHFNVFTTGDFNFQLTILNAVIFEFSIKSSLNSHGTFERMASI
jgi:hypothetical protein